MYFIGSLTATGAAIENVEIRQYEHRVNNPFIILITLEYLKKRTFLGKLILQTNYSPKKKNVLQRKRYSNAITRSK